VEEVREKYQDKVMFIVLYQREAHAGQSMGSLDFSEVEQPETFEARLELAKKSCTELKIATKVVIDDMDDSVRTAYGKRPNSAYFISKGGKIFKKESWAHPDKWDPILAKLLKESTDDPY